jgi:predicted PurR-regulated permease PerM
MRALLLVFACGVLVYLLRNVLVVFAVPLITAYVCAPFVDWLAGRWHAPRWAGALAVFVGLTAVTALAGWLTIPALTQEVQRVAGNLPGTIQSLAGDLLRGAHIELFGQKIDATGLAQRVTAAAENWLAGNGWMEFGAAGVAGVFGAFLSWILLGYFLFDGPGLGRGALELLPPRRRVLAAGVYARLDPVLRRYFLGVVVVVIYAACAAYLGLGVFLRLQHAALLAVLTGVLEIVPIVGPAASAVIAGLIATHESKSPGDIVAYVIYAFALRLSIDQLIGPLVLGRAALASPVLIIFAFMVGGLLFGVLGIILAVPVALAVKVTLATVYEEGRAAPRGPADAG